MFVFFTELRAIRFSLSIFDRAFSTGKSIFYFIYLFILIFEILPQVLSLRVQFLPLKTKMKGKKKPLGIGGLAPLSNSGSGGSGTRRDGDGARFLASMG